MKTLLVFVHTKGMNSLYGTAVMDASKGIETPYDYRIAADALRAAHPDLNEVIIVDWKPLQDDPYEPDIDVSRIVRMESGE